MELFQWENNIVLTKKKKKGGNFAWENFQFCSKMFWFFVKHIELTAVQLLTWKALSAVFHGGKKSNQPKPAKGEAEGHITAFGFQSALLPHLHAQQGKLSSSSLLSTSPATGQEGSVGSPCYSSRSCGERSLLVLPPRNMETASWFHLAPTNKSLQMSSQKPSPWSCFDSWHLFCNFHLYVICFVGLRLLSKSKGFPSEELSVSRPGWPQVASAESFRPQWYREELQGWVWGQARRWAPGHPADSSALCRAGLQQQTAEPQPDITQTVPACAQTFILPLFLFSNTAIRSGTEQDLASDHSKTCLLTRGNSQHLLSPPYSFWHGKRWCLPLGSHLLGAQQ